jgi:hypothetical protein
LIAVLLAALASVGVVGLAVVVVALGDRVAASGFVFEADGEERPPSISEFVASVRSAESLHVDLLAGVRG